MKNLNLKRKHRLILIIASLIGLIGINGPFLFAIIFQPELIKDAMSNIYAMVFIVEAFLLLPLFCFLIWIARLKSPNWFFFLLLSLAGSLAFSIPFSILMWTRKNPG